MSYDFSSIINAGNGGLAGGQREIVQSFAMRPSGADFIGSSGASKRGFALGDYDFASQATDMVNAALMTKRPRSNNADANSAVFDAVAGAMRTVGQDPSVWDMSDTGIDKNRYATVRAPLFIKPWKGGYHNQYLEAVSLFTNRKEPASQTPNIYTGADVCTLNYLFERARYELRGDSIASALNARASNDYEKTYDPADLDFLWATTPEEFAMRWNFYGQIQQNHSGTAAGHVPDDEAQAMLEVNVKNEAKAFNLFDTTPMRGGLVYYTVGHAPSLFAQPLSPNAALSSGAAPLNYGLNKMQFLQVRGWSDRDTGVPIATPRVLTDSSALDRVTDWKKMDLLYEQREQRARQMFYVTELDASGEVVVRRVHDVEPPTFIYDRLVHAHTIFVGEIVEMHGRAPSIADLALGHRVQRAMLGLQTLDLHLGQ